MKPQNLPGLNPQQDLKNVESYEFDLEPIRGYPELRWAGKRPFRSTRYFPAQLKETYGEPVDGWMNQIFWGDNLQVMSHLLKSHRRAIDFIYLDPPFDSKADYKIKIKVRSAKVESDTSAFEEKQYSDIWTNDEYLQYMYERVVLLRELLSEKGTIALHCDWHKTHHLRSILDEVFGPNNFVNEIIWDYRTGGVSNEFFSRKHDNILIYKKNQKYTFNLLKEKNLHSNACRPNFCH